MPADVRAVPAAAAGGEFAHLLPLYEEAFPAGERIGAPQLLQGLQAGERRLWVSGEDAGPGAFATALDLGTGAWLLEHIAAPPRLRGTGAGSRVLAAVLDDLRAHDAQRLYVESEPADTDAVSAGRLAWYERCGARRVPGARRYAMPDQRGGPARPMVLLAAALADAAAPAGDVLERDLVALLHRAYGVQEASAVAHGFLEPGG